MDSSDIGRLLRRALFQHSSSFSCNDIYHIADVTSAVLKRHGYDSCIVGSTACAAWGMDYRAPKDVDIVVLNPRVDLEEVKRSLVASDTRFSLADPVNPTTTYRALWFRHNRLCRVDLLNLEELAIPVDRLCKLTNRNNIRVMPFIPVLLLKVQAWWYHEASSKPHIRNRIIQDIGDIRELLDIAVQKGYKLKDVQSWLPDSFQDLRRHVTQFERRFPDTSNSWAEIMQ